MDALASIYYSYVRYSSPFHLYLTFHCLNLLSVEANLHIHLRDGHSPSKPPLCGGYMARLFSLFWQTFHCLNLLPVEAYYLYIFVTVVSLDMASPD